MREVGGGGGGGEDMIQQTRRLFPMIAILKDRPIPLWEDFRDEHGKRGKISETNTENFQKNSQQKSSLLDLFPPRLRSKFDQHWISLAVSQPTKYFDTETMCPKVLIKILLHFFCKNKN